MRRSLDPSPMPRRRSTIQFRYRDAAAAHRVWWLIVAPGTEVDLCSIDPGYDVDLYASSDLRTMTAIWMGLDTVRKALGEGRMELVGDQLLAKNMQTWLGLSPFAKEQKMVA
jgi:hypothetical protein